MEALNLKAKEMLMFIPSGKNYKKGYYCKWLSGGFTKRNVY
jgi:hypothetical protein